MLLKELKDTSLQYKTYYDTQEPFDLDNSNEYYYLYEFEGDGGGLTSVQNKFVGKIDYDEFQDFYDGISGDFDVVDDTLSSFKKNNKNLKSVLAFDDISEESNVDGKALLFSDGILNKEELKSEKSELNNKYIDYVNSAIETDKESEEERKDPYGDRDVSKSDFN